MKRSAKIGWALAAAILITHIPFGIYALYDGGYFAQGFTAPERYAYHALAATGEHITVSGADRHLSHDVCLFARAGRLRCYLPSELAVDCAGACRLVTPSGGTAASENESYDAAIVEGLLYENATFRCYGRDCGFDLRINENMTYSVQLPGAVARLT